MEDTITITVPRKLVAHPAEQGWVDLCLRYIADKADERDKDLIIRNLKYLLGKASLAMEAGDVLAAHALAIIQ